MKLNNIEIAILVKNRAVSEYFHRGQTFIEGRAGSKYEIEVKNQNPFRVEAIVSVDGLSVIDGESAGAKSSGYVIESNSSIKIPGWKVDAAQAAAFEFAGKATSYSTEMTGSAKNNGVIGVMAFKEKTVIRHHIVQGGYTWASSGHVSAPNLYNFGLRGAGATDVYAANNMVAQSSNATCASLSKSAPEILVQQNLGTSFGEATDFATTEVNFTRGDMLSQLVIYYDDLAALKARGVYIPKKKKIAKVLPDAFPANQQGCKPPPNWQG